MRIKYDNNKKIKIIYIYKMYSVKSRLGKKYDNIFDIDLLYQIQKEH